MIQAAVVDASVAVKWVVAEADSGKAVALSPAYLDGPDLLPVECANILWRKVRAGDLNPGEAGTALRTLLQAPVTLTPSRELLRDALRLALEIGHPVYDCVYLALALLRQAPLVTADRRLVAAARRSSKLAGCVLPLESLPE